MPTLKERWADRTYHPVHRRWQPRARKGTGWLMLCELVGLVPLLIIFGLAQPDLYRSAFWKIGYENGLNSNPNMVLYAYANHRPLPTIALVWTKTLTDFNVAISIISLFFLLAKLILFIMRGWFPIVGVFVNIALTALYAVSVYGQVGPDYADDRYPAPAAWYFRKGCDLARPHDMYRPCQIAQGSLAVTIYMMVIYLLNLGFAIWSMIPNKELNDFDDKDADVDSLDERNGRNTKQVEMRSIKNPVQVNDGPFTPAPFTPRTQAFRSLDRQTPQKATFAPSYK